MGGEAWAYRVGGIVGVIFASLSQWKSDDDDDDIGREAADAQMKQERAMG